MSESTQPLQPGIKKKYKRIAAAWIKPNKFGEDFLTIRFDEDVVLKKGEYVNLWKNRRKFKPTHPDFSLIEKLGGDEEDGDNHETTPSTTSVSPEVASDQGGQAKSVIDQMYEDLK